MFHWGGFSGGDMNRLAQMGVFFILSVVLGKVVELHKKEQLRAREAERLAAIGKSLSAVAHDMKTPLVAIGGMSRLVQRHLPEGSPDREKLEIVIRETQRLENLLKDMLNFSKPLDLNCERVEIRPFIKECLDLIDPIAEDHKISVETVVSAGVSSGYFDPPRVKQALINLAVNAIQASPEGEKVLISCYFRKADLIFEVVDCGCGIPAKERESVFEPFYSTKKVGTGLGLPIVKKIIEAHAGWIELAEGQGMGTTFRIILPCDEKTGCCAIGTPAMALGRRRTVLHR
jgi:signal transduction histidine kinase